MPLEIDISDPMSNEVVGTTVTVVGSYSGDDGQPVAIDCTMVNTAASCNLKQSASINSLEKTWQATFTALTVSEGQGPLGTNLGSYTISAFSANGKRFYSNPVTGVEVESAPPIAIDSVAPITRTPASAGGRKAMHLLITGSYLPDYDFVEGYVINAIVVLDGLQISEQGRLHRMENGEWEYRLRVYSRQTTAILHVELWQVNSGEDTPEPVIALAQTVDI